MIHFSILAIRYACLTTTALLLLLAITYSTAYSEQVHTFRGNVNATGFGGKNATLGVTTLGYGEAGILEIEPIPSPLASPVLFDSSSAGFDAVASKMTDGIDEFLWVRYAYFDDNGPVFSFVSGQGRQESTFFGTDSDLIGQTITRIELAEFNYRVTPGGAQTTALWNIYSVPEPTSLMLLITILLSPLPRRRITRT